MTATTHTVVITAGGTGGHIFPALSLALELRRRYPTLGLVWIGTSRNREKELCDAHGIPLVVLDVEGFRRTLTLGAVRAAFRFGAAVLRMIMVFGEGRPRAVVAFGGYVCAPVLLAARIRKVKYFLQEQNTVAGLVNRVFAKSARRVFLGLPLAAQRPRAGTFEVTGTPVRARDASYAGFAYPEGILKDKKTVLICGGSQGAQSMNDVLVAVVKQWGSRGLQVIWQTGTASYGGVCESLRNCDGIFVFDTIPDLYPYYAVASVVVARAGASTLAEVSVFGIPAVLIPLPWSTENHQWENAGLAQQQGWGIRISQDRATGEHVGVAVEGILSNTHTAQTMRVHALAHSPSGAAAAIVDRLGEDLKL
jgi:UDP-N-acetylglucosamine--N-acetylmuramyl-(pentapeptide) pyrophosphoryl-undecaprenol N-acetylglucosamine transferase